MNSCGLCELSGVTTTSSYRCGLCSKRLCHACLLSLLASECSAQDTLLDELDDVPDDLPAAVEWMALKTECKCPFCHQPFLVRGERLSRWCRRRFAIDSLGSMHLAYRAFLHNFRTGLYVRSWLLGRHIHRNLVQHRQLKKLRGRLRMLRYINRRQQRQLDALREPQ